MLHQSCNLAYQPTHISLNESVSVGEMYEWSSWSFCSAEWRVGLCSLESGLGDWHFQVLGVEVGSVEASIPYLNASHETKHMPYHGRPSFTPRLSSSESDPMPERFPTVIEERAPFS
jgi:hypothetical protein